MSITLATLTQATGQSCTKLELQLLEQKVVGALEWHLLIATLPDWVLFFLHRLQSQQSSEEPSAQTVQSQKKAEPQSELLMQTRGSQSSAAGTQSSGLGPVSGHFGHLSGELCGQSSLPFDLFFRCMDLCDRLLLDSDVGAAAFDLWSSTLRSFPRKSPYRWCLPSAARFVRCVGVLANSHG